MKIGAIFPHLEIGDDPVVIRDWAQTAEGLGYSHIIAYDHVLGAVHADREPRLWGPYTEASSFHEPFVLFGFFAACTTRIGLATGILILPQRQTALVAKQAAEIDVLSGGRLRLGVGTGWNYVEYDSLGESFANRGQRQVEQIDVLRQLWSQPVIDYTGRWHRIDRAGIKPLPGRQIPIWFGGFTDVAFRRAARLGDGFMFGSGHQDNLAALTSVRTALAQEGRDVRSFGTEAFMNYQSGPEHWRSELEDLIKADVDYASMRAMALRGQGDGLGSPRAHITALETYWRAVGDLAS